jgi:hypothetical protein
LESNKIIETCEVTFNETIPGFSPSVSVTGANIQGESIFVDEENESDADEILVPAQ